MPRRPGGSGKGFALALVAHALLIVALAVGVNWRVHDPVGFDAELWAAVPQAAAPRLVEPEARPVPPPEPALPPTPYPKPPPLPKVETPPPAEPAPDAQIAIEQAKREQARLEQARREEQARKEKAKLEQAKIEQAKLELAKREQAKREQAKSDAAQREQARKEALERDRKEQAAKAEQQRREEARLAASREATLKRLQGLAGASGDASATGSALRSSGPSASYAGRIRARIKPNILYTDSIDGNPKATVEVQLAPDGKIVARRLLNSSGVKGWDDAVLRAIDRTEELPRDSDGSVPPKLQIDFRPRD